jgi:aryl-alcohol dehydrogenase-like predicted oxidoreductase
VRYRRLGTSDLEVSEISLGSWLTYSGGVERAQSEACVKAAFEAGINFFDTANVYGNSRGEGLTEKILGRWFAQGGTRRERTVLATKVYGTMGDWPNDEKLSALNIRRACDASLTRLQTDYIDLYQMHHVDRATPWDEIWEAMEVLRFQGKILYAGSSNFAGWHIAKAQEAAARRNFLGLVCEQSLYNLFVRDVEREVLPAALDYGVGIIAWSPLQGGLLGGVLGKVDGTGRRYEDQRAKDTVRDKREQIEAYEALCKEMGEEPANVALAWLLKRPELTAPIIGPRDMAQLEGSLRAVSLADELEPETLSRLDKIFPPYKPAPEDYAW